MGRGAGAGRKMVKRLNKEHSGTTHGHGQQYGVGREEGEAGWRWGKREKARITIIAQTIKIKLKSN